MKVIWNENFIKYRYSNREQYYLKDYFVICRNKIINNKKIPIKESLTNIKVIDNKYIILNGHFHKGDKLIADGIEYVYEEEKQNENESSDEVVEENKPSSGNNIFFDKVKIINSDNEINIESNIDDSVEIKILINEYTNETYPEFPHNTIKKIVRVTNKKLNIHKVKKGTITTLILNDNSGNLIELEYENTPLYHFSTVKSLKDKINDLKLSVEPKEDEYYKKLISEKSIMLKKKFGLTEKEYKNIELFPIFKELVNLYCIQSIISFSYIHGDPIYSESDTSITLGKFKTDGPNTDGTIFSHDALKSIIKTNEDTLYSSLINKAYNFHKKNSFDNNITNNISQFFYTKCKIIRRAFNEFL